MLKQQDLRGMELSWLALKLFSSLILEMEKVFADKMEEVGFHKEGCHCYLLLLPFKVVGTDECCESLSLSGNS